MRTRVPILGAAALAAAAIAAAAGPATAQRVSAGVAPDSVAVGDVFRAAVRVELPPGHRAEFPDTLVLDEDLEPAGRRQDWTERLDDGGLRLTVAYPLTAWRPGRAALPEVGVRVEGPEGYRWLSVPLPELHVRTVLPPDTAGVQPQPPKDVLGANWALWPALFGLLGLLALAAALVYVVRRRRPASVVAPAAPALSPREAVLAALQDARRSGLLEAGDMKAFYSRVSDALRQYLDALDPAWSGDLTTGELLGRMDGAPDGDLARVLTAADLVKFARHRPSVQMALEHWGAARAWALAFEPPVPAEPEPEPVVAGAGASTAASGSAPASGAGAGDREVRP